MPDILALVGGRIGHASVLVFTSLYAFKASLLPPAANSKIAQVLEISIRQPSHIPAGKYAYFQILDWSWPLSCFDACRLQPVLAVDIQKDNFVSAEVIGDFSLRPAVGNQSFERQRHNLDSSLQACTWNGNAYQNGPRGLYHTAHALSTLNSLCQKAMDDSRCADLCRLGSMKRTRCEARPLPWPIGPASLAGNLRN